MPDWSHPRLANPACRITAPSEDIAAEAHAAFTRRRDTYPQLVQAKQMPADDARADLEAWRAIAKDWQWIATGEGEPAGQDSIDARIDALDTAIARWIERADRTGWRMSEDENEQGALLCAMRIWAGRERTMPPHRHIRWQAHMLHEWRRNNGHPTRGAIMAARQTENERTAA